MEGVDLQSVLNKGKQMASNVASSATNGTANKKRRKGTDLKPIVTNDSAMPPGDQPGSTGDGYVFHFIPSAPSLWRCICIFLVLTHFR